PSYSFFYSPPSHLVLPSFPTRRSSDLLVAVLVRVGIAREDRVGDIGGEVPGTSRLLSLGDGEGDIGEVATVVADPCVDGQHKLIDRKSTRLNSSHLVISYAVFCLKKKK